MKKSLVLAMAMALGVTASAYAANPFSDVPAGHWAYDSVSKLAAAGIVQGYGDTTFGGDKLMTRYEMAEIVAKAMAKGANVDKLAAEFADELNALGVRVAKLEKKADNVKITGRYRAQAKAFHGAKGTNNWSRLRSDLTIKGQINEDWTYTALLRNEQRLDKGKKNAGEEGVNVKNAYVAGKLGGLNVVAGHYFEYLADGFIYDWTADGVVASYGTKKLNVTGGYAQLDTVDLGEAVDTKNNIAYGVVNAALGKAAKVTVGYYNMDGISVYESRDLVSAKLALNLGKSLTAAYTYIHSDEKDADGGNRAHNIAVNFKGANKAKVGSYGLEVIHYDQDAASYVAGAHTMDGKMPYASFKGWKVGAGYTLAKNVLLNVAWYDLESKKDGDRTGTLFTDLNFYF